MPLKLDTFKKSDIYEHLQTLYDYALKAQIILELGVREGESTKAFLEACKTTGGKVISIDIQDCHTVSEDLNWQFIQSDDLDIGWDKDIDLLFIDTSHDYGQTLAELEKFIPFVKRGGVILMHDTDNKEVRQAIGDYLKDKLENYRIEIRDNCYGLGILTKL